MRPLLWSLTIVQPYLGDPCKIADINCSGTEICISLLQLKYAFDKSAIIDTKLEYYSVAVIIDIIKLNFNTL